MEPLPLSFRSLRRRAFSSFLCLRKSLIEWELKESELATAQTHSTPDCWLTYSFRYLQIMPATFSQFFLVGQNTRHECFGMTSVTKAIMWSGSIFCIELEYWGSKHKKIIKLVSFEENSAVCFSTISHSTFKKPSLQLHIKYWEAKKQCVNVQPTLKLRTRENLKHSSSFGSTS